MERQRYLFLFLDQCVLILEDTSLYQNVVILEETEIPNFMFRSGSSNTRRDRDTYSHV